MIGAAADLLLQVPLNGAGPMLIYNKTRSYQVREAIFVSVHA